MPNPSFPSYDSTNRQSRFGSLYLTGQYTNSNHIMILCILLFHIPCDTKDMLKE